NAPEKKTRKRQPAQTFKTLKDAMGIRPPTKKPFIEALHYRDTHFGIRVMRPKKKNGQVTRTWFVRLGDTRETLGDAPPLNVKDQEKKEQAKKIYEQAHLDADAKILAYRTKIKAGISVLHETLQEAYDAYKLETSNKWSPVTLENYEN